MWLVRSKSNYASAAKINEIIEMHKPNANAMRQKVYATSSIWIATKEQQMQPRLHKKNTIIRNSLIKLNSWTNLNKDGKKQQHLQ